MNLEKRSYRVERLDGDYAYLQSLEEESASPKCVARALLPPEIAEGSELSYELMEYSLVKY